MKSAERSHLFVAAASHPGITGKNNEDRYSVSAYRLDDGADQPSLFAVVADGIGGHRGGEVAAELAVESISRAIAGSDGAHPEQTMQTAIIAASESIFRQSEQEINLRGMGSTCACVWVIADRLYIANVGDTRIYLVRGGLIRQLTTDHTWIQEAIDQGMLTPEQAKNHPNTHIIRRYLGSRLPVEPNLRIRPEVNALLNPFQRERGLLLQQGDRILLCSDGLTDLVEDSEILNAFQSQPIQTALEVLVRLANQRGGHDNITLVALEVPDGYIAEPPLNTRRRRIPVGYAAAGLLVLLGIMLVSSLLCGYLSLPAFLYAVHPPTTATLQEQGVPGLATPAATDRSGTSQPILKNAPGSVTPETNLSEPVLKPTLTPWPTNTPIP